MKRAMDIINQSTYLSLKEQNCWLITCQTISSDDMVIEDFEKLKLFRVLEDSSLFFFSSQHEYFPSTFFRGKTNSAGTSGEIITCSWK